MKKLRHPVLRAMLHDYTELSPIVNNKTRWFSIYFMLQRCMQLKNSICKFDVPEVANLLLGTRADSNVKALCRMLQSLDSLTNLLQREHITLI